MVRLMVREGNCSVTTMLMLLKRWLFSAGKQYGTGRRSRRECDVAVWLCACDWGGCLCILYACYVIVLLLYDCYVIIVFYSGFTRLLLLPSSVVSI